MTIIVTGGAGFIGSNFVFHMLSILHGTQREQQTASQPEAGMCLSDVRNISPTSKDRKSTRLNSSHRLESRMPSSA